MEVTVKDRKQRPDLTEEGSTWTVSFVCKGCFTMYMTRPCDLQTKQSECTECGHMNGLEGREAS